MSRIFKQLQMTDKLRSGIIYRNVLMNLDHRIYIKDVNLDYLFCNEAYANDFNITPDEISGKSDYDLFSKELADRIISEEKEIIDSGIKWEREERNVVSGQELTLRITKVPVRNDNGDIIGLQAVLQDTTKDKRRTESILYLIKNLEEQLSQSESKIHTLESYIEKITAHRNEMEARISDLQERTKRQMFIRDAQLEKLKNDLQRETTKYTNIFDILQKSFAQFWDLMNSAKHLTRLSNSEDRYEM